LFVDADVMNNSALLPGYSRHGGTIFRLVKTPKVFFRSRIFHNDLCERWEGPSALRRWGPPQLVGEGRNPWTARPRPVVAGRRGTHDRIDRKGKVKGRENRAGGTPKKIKEAKGA